MIVVDRLREKTVPPTVGAEIVIKAGDVGQPDLSLFIYRSQLHGLACPDVGGAGIDAGLSTYPSTPRRATMIVSAGVSPEMAISFNESVWLHIERAANPPVPSAVMTALRAAIRQEFISIPNSSAKVELRQ